MISFSELFVTIFGGYSSEKEREKINQAQVEYHLKSMVQNKNMLEEILQQAADARSMRS